MRSKWANSTGKERDTESGLDNFGARYYGAALGRFMTPDWAARPTSVPYADFSDPQTLNLYTYVRNSPLSKADADGHGCVVDGEKHNWLWCAAHSLGLVETQKEHQAELHRQAEFIRRHMGSKKLYINGKLVDWNTLSDQEVLNTYSNFTWANWRGAVEYSATTPFMTQWGWNNSQAYRQARAELEQPGTHEQLNGKVPTREEAARMIEENGGKVVRSEGPHGPDTSTHNYPHINYETSSGLKGTVRVQQ